MLTSNDGDPHPLPSKTSTASVSESNCLRKLSWHAFSHCASGANLQQCKTARDKKNKQTINDLEKNSRNSTRREIINSTYICVRRSDGRLSRCGNTYDGAAPTTTRLRNAYRAGRSDTGRRSPGRPPRVD